jgi:transposase
MGSAASSKSSFNKIKRFRRVATRDDKLAESFLAAVKLTSIRIWLSDL